MTQPFKRIALTGGSGKLGRAVVEDLHGANIGFTNLDLVRPDSASTPGVPTLRTDLTDLGQTIDAIRGHDAVLHLAAIPAPGLMPEQETFRINTISTFNVFHAAAVLGIGRVVWASSETTLGLAFSPDAPPMYAPVDEDHFPLANSSYALSKVVGERMAEQFTRRSGMTIVGLRFSNVLTPRDYAEVLPPQRQDPKRRMWNLWGYIDARDAAAACRLALSKPISGADNFIIAAADTVMDRSSKDLMAKVFPGVEIRKPLGEHETLLSIEKARRVLGFEPKYSWR